MQLVRPAREHLASYVAALERGWSPDTARAEVVAREQLDRIAADADRFLDLLDDREAKGGPVTLPDGSTRQRIPGFARWMWDGEFCGSINLRWQCGSAALPSHVLGHVGYTVVPWKRRQGHATSALAQLLPLAREVGLPWIEITTDPDNSPSQRVILANDGRLVETFRKDEAWGGKPGLRFRIDLQAAAR